MPYLGIFDRNLKRILSYLKSAPSNLSNCKISGKNKNHGLLKIDGLICCIISKEIEGLQFFLKTSFF